MVIPDRAYPEAVEVGGEAGWGDTGFGEDVTSDAGRLPARIRRSGGGGSKIGKNMNKLCWLTTRKVITTKQTKPRPVASVALHKQKGKNETKSTLLASI